jgi:hypothetical protein
MIGEAHRFSDVPVETFPQSFPPLDAETFDWTLVLPKMHSS